MLKIKESVDLKELEKFGFKQEHWGYIYYPKNNSPQTRYFSSIKIDGDKHKDLWSHRVLSFCFQNMSSWCNDLEQLELDFDNIRYSYNEFKKLVDDLIKADIVEKVEE